MKKLKLKKEIVVSLDGNRDRMIKAGSNLESCYHFTCCCKVTNDLSGCRTSQETTECATNSCFCPETQDAKCESNPATGCIKPLTDMCNLSKDYCASIDVCSLGQCSDGCVLPTNTCDTTTITPIG